MTDNLMDVLVFKTNIRTESDKQHVKKVFDALQGIEEWSVDCEDVDCVLRVVSHVLSTSQIIELMTKAGFECLELE
jgi:hypothetical protein